MTIPSAIEAVKSSVMTDVMVPSMMPMLGAVMPIPPRTSPVAVIMAMSSPIGIVVRALVKRIPPKGRCEGCVVVVHDGLIGNGWLIFGRIVAVKDSFTRWLLAKIVGVLFRKPHDVL